jgi:uncharacterized HAD superfamily protein
MDLAYGGVPKRIAIDIDSTLHNYWNQFREVALRHSGIDLPYETQTDWHISELGREALVEIVGETHSEPMVLAAQPYPGAVQTVNGWHAAGHFIHITSHRSTDTYAHTRRWLDAIGLAYDELYLSYDKVSRCVEIGIDVLIDDSPANLRSAQERGIAAATLTHPWNADACREHGWTCAPDWESLAGALAPVLGA